MSRHILDSSLDSLTFIDSTREAPHVSTPSKQASLKIAHEVSPS